MFHFADTGRCLATENILLASTPVILKRYIEAPLKSTLLILQNKWNSEKVGIEHSIGYTSKRQVNANIEKINTENKKLTGGNKM